MKISVDIFRVGVTTEFDCLNLGVILGSLVFKVNAQFGGMLKFQLFLGVCLFFYIYYYYLFFDYFIFLFFFLFIFFFIFIYLLFFCGGGGVRPVDARAEPT